MFSKKELDKIKEYRFSKEIHNKIKKSKVAVAGLGGLGSNIATILVRSGVVNLHIIDFDKVDLSNINRQNYSLKDVGKYKTKAIMESLMEINPYLNLKIDNIKIKSENIKDIFLEDEIICEAFDEAEQKAMLINGIFSLFNDKKVIAGSGMAGIVDANKIITRKVLKNLYLCGDLISGIENNVGIYAPKVQICAGHQANKVLEIIVNGE